MTEDKLNKLLIKIGHALICKGLETSGTLTFSTEGNDGILNITVDKNKLFDLVDDAKKILDNNSFLGGVSEDEIREAARGIIEEKLKAAVP